MQLLAIFGLLALVLCAIGIYSVLAYSVKRSMREIGLRHCSWSHAARRRRLVIVQGMKPTLAASVSTHRALALGGLPPA